MSRVINPKYLKKNLGRPLTNDEVVNLTKLLQEGKVKGEIHPFRGNYYFIQEPNGNNSQKNS